MTHKRANFLCASCVIIFFIFFFSPLGVSLSFVYLSLPLSCHLCAEQARSRCVDLCLEHMGFPPHPPTRRTRGDSKQTQQHSRIHTPPPTRADSRLAHALTGRLQRSPQSLALSELFSLRWRVAFGTRVRVELALCVLTRGYICTRVSACVNKKVFSSRAALGLSSALRAAHFGLQKLIREKLQGKKRCQWNCR